MADPQLPVEPATYPPGPADWLIPSQAPIIAQPGTVNADVMPQPPLPQAPRERTEQEVAAEAIGLAQRGEPLSNEHYTVLRNLDARRAAQAAGAGGQVKLGENRSTTTSSGGMVKTPEMGKARAAVGSALDQQASGAVQLGKLQAAQTAEETAVADQRVAMLNERNAKVAADQSAHEDSMRKLEARLSEDRATYAKEAAGLDPDRLLRSGGKRAMAAIGMALGAYGAALAKTPNYAMQIINDALDRDYRGQKDRLAGKRDDLSFTEKNLERQRMTFSDKVAAEQMARANDLGAMDAQVQAIGTKHKGGIVEQNAAQTSALIQTEKARLEQDALYKEAQHKQTNSTTSSTYSSATGAAGGKAGQPAGIMAELKENAAVEHARQEAFGNKRDPADATHTNKVLDQFRAFGGVISNLDKYKQQNLDAETVIPGVDKSLFGMKSNAVKFRNSTEGSITGDLVRAQTGASARADETEAEVAKLTGNSAFASDRNDVAENRVNYVASVLKASYDTLPASEQALVRERLKGNRAMFEAVVSGQAPKSWADLATDQGAARVRGQ